MASANYKLIGSIATTEMRSPTSAIAVEELTVSTRPTGVIFVRNVPEATWVADTWRTSVATIAGNIEHIFAARPHVIAASPVQLVDDQGIITNAVRFLVSYTADDGAGPFQDSVTIPVQALHDDKTFDKYFDPVVKRLAAAAAEA
jgi:hypothetical protein